MLFKQLCLGLALLSFNFYAWGQAPKPSMDSEVRALVGPIDKPKSYVLCAADEVTRACKGKRVPTAKGLGGLFIPLCLNVRSMTIARESDRGDDQTEGTLRNVKVIASFDTRVNGIAPKCKNANGQVELKPGIMEFQSFYCRWLAVGNVATRVKLTIDQVNPDDGTFSGQYRLRLNRTANMFGRGYFLPRRNSVSCHSSGLT